MLINTTTVYVYVFLFKYSVFTSIEEDFLFILIYQMHTLKVV